MYFSALSFLAEGESIPQIFGLNWPAFHRAGGGVPGRILRSEDLRVPADYRRAGRTPPTHRRRVRPTPSGSSGQLAESEAKHRETLDQANAQAQKLINEARQSSDALASRRAQEAVTEAERIIARAREATTLEHDRVLSEVKRELGRLVIETTSKVTGKVLTPEDQQRLGEETTRQIA